MEGKMVMAINQRSGRFKQAHQLTAGDKVALHYSEPCAEVVLKVSGERDTTLVIVVPNNEPVRCATSD